jgi:putative hydrolase of the HAD superfamily
VSKSAVKTVVFIDADNTLWDTNRVYADAQLALLADVEIATGFRAPEIDKLDWLRAIDQLLAEKHHAGLRYPPRLLAKAVALALKGPLGHGASIHRPRQRSSLR